MNESAKKLLEKADWPILIKELTRYAYSRFRFWRLLSNKGLLGYSPEDIALEAIEAVFCGTWNWDPSRDKDLEYFLKFRVVNGLVANLARKKEVRLGDQIDIQRLYIKDEFSAEEELNAQQIIEQVRESIKNDQVLIDIFECLYQGMERREVCEDLTLTSSEYDNAIRRLKTKLAASEKEGLFGSLTK